MSLAVSKKKVALLFATTTVALSFSAVSASADTAVRKGNLADFVNQVAPANLLNKNTPVKTTPIDDENFQFRMFVSDGVGGGPGGFYGMNLKYSTGGLGWH